jgi:uncharacterized protein
MKNVVVWFEIPVKDLGRAIEFYSKMLSIDMKAVEYGPTKMAFFPFNEDSVSGALVADDENRSSEKGTLIYLNGGEDLSTPLSRIASAGGKILQEKMSIGEHGFVAIFLDTEGNRVALHSMK